MNFRKQVTSAWHIRKMHFIRILVATFISLIVSAVFFAFFYAQAIQTLAQSVVQILLPEELNAISARIPSMKSTIITWFGYMLAVNTVIVFVASAYVSNKLAQQVQHFEGCLRRIADGDLSVEIDLEKEDDLAGLAKNTSDTIALLQLMVMSTKESVDLLKKIETDEATRKQLDLPLTNLDTAMEYFKTVPLNGKD